jgi:hypothetical protein
MVGVAWAPRTFFDVDVAGTCAVNHVSGQFQSSFDLGTFSYDVNGLWAHGTLPGECYLPDVEEPVKLPANQRASLRLIVKEVSCDQLVFALGGVGGPGLTMAINLDGSSLVLNSRTMSERAHFCNVTKLLRGSKTPEKAVKALNALLGVH